jgi:hypothetical protein
MNNKWMLEHNVLKKLKCSQEELNDLVSKIIIIKRYSNNTYLRSDVERVYKNAKLNDTTIH